MSLSAAVRVRRGPVEVDVGLEVAEREVLAVLGPNGAGKSSLLRVLAGLLEPDGGRVSVGGEVWDDVAAGTHLPPHLRSLGMVFQDALLFPHLDVGRQRRVRPARPGDAAGARAGRGAAVAGARRAR